MPWPTALVEWASITAAYITVVHTVEPTCAAAWVLALVPPLSVRRSRPRTITETPAVGFIPIRPASDVADTPKKSERLNRPQIIFRLREPPSELLLKRTR